MTPFLLVDAPPGRCVRADTALWLELRNLVGVDDVRCLFCGRWFKRRAPRQHWSSLGSIDTLRDHMRQAHYAGRYHGSWAEPPPCLDHSDCVEFPVLGRFCRAVSGVIPWHDTMEMFERVVEAVSALDLMEDERRRRTKARLPGLRRELHALQKSVVELYVSWQEDFLLEAAA